jgi:hypothetical protein
VVESAGLGDSARLDGWGRAVAFAGAGCAQGGHRSESVVVLWTVSCGHGWEAAAVRDGSSDLFGDRGLPGLAVHAPEVRGEEGVAAGVGQRVLACQQAVRTWIKTHNRKSKAEGSVRIVVYFFLAKSL